MEKIEIEEIIDKIYFCNNEKNFLIYIKNLIELKEKNLNKEELLLRIYENYFLEKIINKYFIEKKIMLKEETEQNLIFTLYKYNYNAKILFKIFYDQFSKMKKTISSFKKELIFELMKEILFPKLSFLLKNEIFEFFDKEISYIGKITSFSSVFFNFLELNSLDFKENTYFSLIFYEIYFINKVNKEGIIYFLQKIILLNKFGIIYI